MVDAGPQYHMGKLTIDGSNLLTEPQIRKVSILLPGSPFRSLTIRISF